MRELIASDSSSTDASNLVSLRELIDFIAHVADCYPKLTREFPNHLSDLLLKHHEGLEPELREKIVGSLVLLRKKELIDSSRFESHFVVSYTISDTGTACSIPSSRC